MEDAPAVRLGNSNHTLGWHAHGFKPAADIHLGVSLTAEVAGGGAHGGCQIPLDDCELLISALDHKPMNRILTDDPANLALVLLQTRHTFSDEPSIRQEDCTVT